MNVKKITGSLLALGSFTLLHELPSGAQSSITVEDNKSGAAVSESGAQQTAACRAHLERIYAAIQEYRKANKKLPDYFHDLVPQYLSDTNVFLCPMGSRESIQSPYPYLDDPNLPSHYNYEFSARECGDMWGGGKTTMAEWKSLQMSVVGGVVPIVRCSLHDPVLNVSFDGKFYESSAAWEYDQAAKVDFADITPPALRLRLHGILRGTTEQSLALDRLTCDETKVERFFARESGAKEKKANSQLATLAMEVADQASQFEKGYPKSVDLSTVRRIHRNMIWVAARAGDHDARRKFDKIVESAKGQSLPESERLEIRTVALMVDGANPGDGSLDEPARALIKDFPKQAGAYWFFLSCARDSTDEQHRKSLAREILKMDASPDAVKKEARTIIEKARP